MKIESYLRLKLAESQRQKALLAIQKAAKKAGKYQSENERTGLTEKMAAIAADEKLKMQSAKAGWRL